VVANELMPKISIFPEISTSGNKSARINDMAEPVSLYPTQCLEFTKTTISYFERAYLFFVLIKPDLFEGF